MDLHHVTIISSPLQLIITKEESLTWPEWVPLEY